MQCDKCGMPDMINDSAPDIEVYRCWMCGNRMYANHPKSIGVLNCVKCGQPIKESNVFNYCKECLEGLKVFRKKGSPRPDGSSRQGRHQVSGATGRIATRKRQS